MAPIRRLLVANRGEIGRRIVRTARALGIGTVAVASTPDLALPFAREADVVVELPGSAPSETYLDIDAVLRAAAQAGADALHPGYGFLAENAELARRCAAAGVVFVGPPPEAIEQMGSKLAAKRLMAEHGVPVLPGEVVESVDDLLAAGDAHGWPVLLKAAYGGGGRGMRAVAGPEEAAAALEATRREAAGAFGDATVFAERLVARPRHVEVQILGDREGNVVHLFERECSIQRRFQKVIEEAPSPAVDERRRAELGEAAIRAARALSYVGAGTVEFVLDDAGEPYFLEVNTRLQVEHPVTEAVTGLDLVALQIRLAEGAPLPPEVLSARLDGHAVEVRLYAEDVAAGFLPVAGTMHRFALPARPGVRVDAAIESGDTVSPHYDALLAKVIAWGPTRPEAIRRLASALGAAELHGLATNRELLVQVLDDPAFAAGEFDTGFLGRHPDAGLPGSTNEASCRLVHAVAVAVADAARRRAGAGVQPGIPPGWRNVGGLQQRAVYRDDDGELVVRYAFDRTCRVAGGVEDGEAAGLVEPAEILRVAPDTVELLAGGRLLEVRVARYGDDVFADSALGHTHLTEVDRFPLPQSAEEAGSLRAPMPGTVTKVLVSEGDTVARGEVVVILEAMKMEHPVASPSDGLVTAVPVSEGQQLEAGAVLAVVEPAGTDS